METNQKKLVEDMIEVTLPESDNFLKVKETLTRIGVASASKKELYQSVHILHKSSSGTPRFYIVSFKELFMLDGKPTNFSEEDRARRNTIANLLAEWGLVKLVDPSKSKEPVCPLNKIKILSYKEKDQWTLIPKYTIGKAKKKEAVNG